MEPQVLLPASETTEAETVTFAAAATNSTEASEAGVVVSPFLPNSQTQYAWDSTSLGWLKTCPRLYYYKMICGYTSEVESVHLRFGIEYHRALQDYDLSRATGIPHDDAVHDVVRELLIRTGDFKADHRYKNRHLLVRSVIGYLDKFSTDPAKTLIRPDGSPAVEVSFRFNLDWSPTGWVGQHYMLCGHLDRVVEFHDELFVMDRKTTTTTLSQHYFAQFEPNNQMTLYTLASQVILEAHVKGVIIDAVQIMIEDWPRYVRDLTYRSQEQLDEWVESLSEIFQRQQAYAEAEFWPMNDTACDKFGGCEFRTICSKSPQVRDQMLKATFKVKKWNPLIPRD